MYEVFHNVGTVCVCIEADKLVVTPGPAHMQNSL